MPAGFSQNSNVLREERMMKRHLMSLCFVFPLFLLCVPAALADEVHLMNGDRISGKIIRMEEDKLVVKTDYAWKLGE